jgi:hypothetical protein
MSHIAPTVQPSINGALPETRIKQIQQSKPFQETASLRSKTTKVPNNTPIRILTTEPVFAEPAVPQQPITEEQSNSYQAKKERYEHFMVTSSIIKIINPNTEVFALPEDDTNKVANRLEDNNLTAYFSTLAQSETPLLAGLKADHQNMTRRTRRYLDVARDNHIKIINDSTGLSIIDINKLIEIYLDDYARLKRNQLNTNTLTNRYQTEKNLTKVIDKILTEIKATQFKADLDRGFVPQALTDKVLSKLDQYINTDEALLSEQRAMAKLVDDAKKKDGILWIQSAGNDGETYPATKNQLGIDIRIPSEKMIVGSTNNEGPQPISWSSQGPAVDFTEQQGLQSNSGFQGTSLSAPAFTAVLTLAMQSAEQLQLPHDMDNMLKVIKATAENGDIRPLAIQAYLEKQALQKQSKPATAVKKKST